MDRYIYTGRLDLYSQGHGFSDDKYNYAWGVFKKLGKAGKAIGKGVVGAANAVADATVDVTKAAVKQVGQTSLRSHKTWRQMEDLKELDAAQDELESLINPLDEEVTKIVDSLEDKKDNEAHFDSDLKRADNKDTLIDDYEKQLKDIEDKIQKLIKEGKNPKALQRKYNRLQRQDARKHKRKLKRAVKKGLRDKYGKGSDYRKAKAKAKDIVKDEKKDTLNKYGGTFARRVVVNLAAAPVRNAFLSVVSLNVGNVGAALGKIKDKDPERYNKILTKFYNWGGTKSNLDGAVKDGMSKKPLLGVKVISANGEYYNVTGAGVAAFITAATPLLGVIVPIIKGFTDKDAPKLDPDLPDSPHSVAERQQLIDAVNSSSVYTEEQKKLIVSGLNAGLDLGTAVSNAKAKIPEGDEEDNTTIIIVSSLVGLSLLGGLAWLLFRKK